MKNVLKAILLLGFVGIINSCGYANLDDIKFKASYIWKNNGYSIQAYEGFQWGRWLGGSYGGAKVWYIVNRVPDNGISYNGYITKWGNEYHIYDLHALDAIKP